MHRYTAVVVGKHVRVHRYTAAVVGKHVRVHRHTAVVVGKYVRVHFEMDEHSGVLKKKYVRKRKKRKYVRVHFEMDEHSVCFHEVAHAMNIAVYFLEVAHAITHRCTPP